MQKEERNCHTINTWQQFNLQVDYVVNSCVCLSDIDTAPLYPLPSYPPSPTTPLSRSLAPVYSCDMQSALMRIHIILCVCNFSLINFIWNTLENWWVKPGYIRLSRVWDNGKKERVFLGIYEQASGKRDIYALLIYFVYCIYINNNIIYNKDIIISI